MPEMSGITLCRRLRLKSDVPIVALSVKSEEHIKVEALDAGASVNTNVHARLLFLCFSLERAVAVISACHALVAIKTSIPQSSPPTA